MQRSVEPQELNNQVLQIFRRAVLGNEGRECHLPVGYLVVSLITCDFLAKRTKNMLVQLLRNLTLLSYLWCVSFSVPSRLPLSSSIGRVSGLLVRWD